MLDEREWELVVPHLEKGVERIKSHRQTFGVSLEEAKDEVYWRQALTRYNEITGFRETDPQVIWHHRLSIYGPPCSVCGNLLRTARAKQCAACGAPANRS